MTHHNAFKAFRDTFPSDLNAVAVINDQGLAYSWLDLERASAMMANLLIKLNLPAHSRVVLQLQKSAEAMVLLWAVWRSGHVAVSLDTAWQAEEVESCVIQAKPAVVVCMDKDFSWVSQIAFQHGTQNVFTLNDDRTGTLLWRASHCADQHEICPVNAHDLAVIQFASNTPGQWSSEVLTHEALRAMGLNLQTCWEWSGRADALQRNELSALE